MTEHHLTKPTSDVEAQHSIGLRIIAIYKARERDVEAYSALSGTGLAEELRARRVRRVFVAGLATDYCVVNSVRDPRDLGIESVVLDNRKCAFVPHVISATVGQTLEIHNSDSTLHDAHAWLGARSLFNVGILPGRSRRQPLTDTGLVHINCNVRHTWMHAYLFVAPDPYHAVTGPDGRFTIDQVPPGTYTVRVWHELLGSIDRPVIVEAGKTATVDVALPVVAPVPPPHAP